MEPVILSVEDAQKALGGIGRSKLYDLIGRKHLDARKLGRRTFITTASIRALAEQLEAA